MWHGILRQWKSAPAEIRTLKIILQLLEPFFRFRLNTIKAAQQKLSPCSTTCPSLHQNWWIWKAFPTYTLKRAKISNSNKVIFFPSKEFTMLYQNSGQLITSVFKCRVGDNNEMVCQEVTVFLYSEQNLRIQAPVLTQRLNFCAISGTDKTSLQAEFELFSTWLLANI